MSVCLLVNETYFMFYNGRALNIAIIVLKGRSDGYSGDSELVVEKVILEQENGTLLTGVLYIFIVLY